jgi:1-deoxy-D-xylulose-5-phosphate reductoisomerase
VAQLDLTTIAQLLFERPDFSRFPCLKLAYDALQAGGTAPAILNAANEVAVQAFLNREIGFRMIDQLIARVMETVSPRPVTDIDDLIEQNRYAREVAYDFVQS